MELNFILLEQNPAVRFAGLQSQHTITSTIFSKWLSTFQNGCPTSQLHQQVLDLQVSCILTSSSTLAVVFPASSSSLSFPIPSIPSYLPLFKEVDNTNFIFLIFIFLMTIDIKSLFMRLFAMYMLVDKVSVQSYLPIQIS